MQFAGALDLVELCLDARNAILDDSPVRFDLGLARAAKKAKSATLTLKMCPRADQSNSSDK